MKTLQTRFFEHLEETLGMYDLELLVEYSFTNAGSAYIVRPGGFDSLFAFTFSFTPGHNVFESQDPVWPDAARAGKNPRMFIARSADDVGTCLDQIRGWVEDH